MEGTGGWGAAAAIVIVRDLRFGVVVVINTQGAGIHNSAIGPIVAARLGVTLENPYFPVPVWAPDADTLRSIAGTYQDIDGDALDLRVSADDNALSATLTDADGIAHPGRFTPSLTDRFDVLGEDVHARVHRDDAGLPIAMHIYGVSHPLWRPPLPPRP